MRHNILSCNENSTVVITIEVLKYMYYITTVIKNFNIFWQPPTEFANNTTYTVNLLNTCTNVTMKILNNLNSLTFRISDPHMWTNITVIVKNQCRESLIPVSFNSTGELTVVYMNLNRNYSSCYVYISSGMSYVTYCHTNYQND